MVGNGAATNNALQILNISAIARNFNGQRTTSFSELYSLNRGQMPSWHDQQQSGIRSRYSRLVKALNEANPEKAKEIRVCLNRACRKSGSRETLDILISLAPPNVKVNSCGCLGRCGSGPNLVVLPAEIFVSHCSTPALAARLIAIQCGASDPENNLTAHALKEQGNNEFQCGNLDHAEELFSQAIDLNPSGGLHSLYANRSVVRLARGDNLGALADAQEASRIAPNWHMACLHEGDAYFAIGEYEAAQCAYLNALAIEPPLRRSKSFKAKIQKLQEQFAFANTSS